MLQTAFTRRFGIEHPIVQAGMGHEASAALAAAVSNAGALGTIGSIGGTPDHLQGEIRRCRELTTRPFAVNLVTWPWAPWALELIDLTLAERPPVVTLSFGEPLLHVERCKAAGIPTIVQVQDLVGARATLAAGPDAVIAQGNEAGGHTGRRGTLAFAAQVLDLAGDLPVLVAGGIATGRGVAAALAMGAAGAVLGTRFKASVEFAGPDALKEAIVASDGSDTLHDEILDDACGLEWPRGVTGRALRNHFTAEWEGKRAALRAKVATYPPFGFIAELDQDPSTRINWAGESSGLVDEVRPAADIVRAVVADTEARLRSITPLLDPR
ncbi:MAG: NAD(P)H-dependent flavin oxidoreductase [Candidatus Binatia bacterium]